MNLITKNNYEAYLLDYLEDNLSPELTAELMLLLENNPELKDELEQYEKIQLFPPLLDFTAKDELKKKEELITVNNCEKFIIQEIEGENTKEISTALHLFLDKNLNQQANFSIYQKTKLVAPTVIFSNKKLLKKNEGIIIPMYWWYSSAAAIVLILFLLKGLTNAEKQKIHPIANNHKIIVPIQNKQLVNKEKKEDNDLANQTIKKLSLIAPKKKKVNPKNLFIIPEEEESLKIVLENSVPIIKSTKDSLPANSSAKPLITENYFVDDVNITFEEDTLPIARNETESKFKILTRALTKLLTKKFIKQEKNENGDVLAYAVHVGEIGFSRKKRVKK